jgi:hypothetical protein
MHDKIKAIAATYQEAKDKILTEEATKNALIMPFISALGYNVFNPLEVIPEFDAGVAGKKGEKADYAIKLNDAVVMLIECKLCGSPLNDKAKIKQLFHYFAACRARLAILTDGLEYHFFSDTEAPNVMDEAPFFVFNIHNFDEPQFAELQRFAKANFDIEGIICKAAEMKRIAAVGDLLGKYMVEPTENFIKTVLDDLEFHGRKTEQIISSYGQTIKEAFAKFVKDKVSLVLRDALKQNQGGLEGIENIITAPFAPAAPAPPPEAAAPADDGIVTTPEEIEAYAIIKSIGREVVASSRIVMRDAKSYCSILLDNKNYKPIVRLHFNNLASKRLNLFSGPQDKKGEMVPIGELDEIYKYADKIRAQIQAYDAAPAAPATDAETGTESEGAVE